MYETLVIIKVITHDFLVDTGSDESTIPNRYHLTNFYLKYTPILSSLSVCDMTRHSVLVLGTTIIPIFDFCIMRFCCDKFWSFYFETSTLEAVSGSFVVTC